MVMSLDEMIDYYDMNIDEVTTAKKTIAFWKGLFPELLKQAGISAVEFETLWKDKSNDGKPRCGKSLEAFKILRYASITLRKTDLNFLISFRFVRGCSIEDYMITRSVSKGKYYSLEKDSLILFALRFRQYEDCPDLVVMNEKKSKNER